MAVLLGHGFVAVSRVSAQDVTGRIAGAVVDAQTGRPIPEVEVTVIGTSLKAQSDLEGKFRFGSVSVGTFSVSFRRLGYQVVRRDSVKVEAVKVTTVNVSLSAATVMLDELKVEAAPEKANTAAGLLGMEQAAASASDGISQEQIEKTPDSDAGQSAARISGVAVTDNKYVVVRGLDERYTSTLLNGAELASAEPLKRVVPLDVFPANLLESIVATKAALPNMPGDFAGASLNIQTKDFPEAFTASLKITGEWNSQTTGQIAAYGPSSFSDRFGIDGQGRGTPTVFPVAGDAPTPGVQPPADALVRQSLYASQVRNVWNPSGSPGLNGKFSGSIGGSVPTGAESRFGYVASLTYSDVSQTLNDQIFRILGGLEETRFPLDNTIDASLASVDWGGILNFSYALNGANQFGLRNFYNRGAEELFATTVSYFEELNSQTQTEEFSTVRYITRSTWQSQLYGNHQTKWLTGLGISWKASYSQAQRDEPENRSLIRSFSEDGSTTIGSAGGQFLTYNAAYRFLDDATWSGQGDFTLPVPIGSGNTGLLSTGGYIRQRSRDFVGARVFGAIAGQESGIPTGDLIQLSNEEFWSPENFAGPFILQNQPSAQNSYASDDGVAAGYLMLDVLPLRWLRAAGGVRYEDWSIDVYAPTRPGQDLPGLGSADSVSAALIESGRYQVNKSQGDWLPSLNLTFLLNSRMNLRFAGFQSVARPDARELSIETYTDVGGACSLTGNPNLEVTNIRNLDAKWEFYPSAGEIIAVSGFYKHFTRPTVQVIGAGGQGRCAYQFAQAAEAEDYGLEFEARIGLGSLSRALSRFTIGGNAALIRTKAILDSTTFGAEFDGQIAKPLVGQSPYLLNFNVGYETTVLGVSVYYNYFGDRVLRYGAFPLGDQVEQARGTLDARVRVLWGQTTFSLYLRNLTNNIVTITQTAPNGTTALVGQQQFGTSVGLQVGYAF